MPFRRFILGGTSLLVLTSSAVAQSNPGFVTGQVPTAQNWNNFFSNKQDYPIPSGVITPLCNVFTSTSSGCVSGSGGGTANFLRADGSWAAPGGTGGITALTGDVAASGTGSVAATIQSGVVTGGKIASNTVANSNLVNMSANTVKGSIAGGTPVDLTATQLTTLCNTVTASLSGCIPSFPNNTTTFFRGDGTYTTISPGALTTGTRGSILEQGAGGWAAIAPGTLGFPWVSNGAGADPGYQVLTGAALAVPFTQSLAISANQATVSGFGYNPISIGIRTSSDNAPCTCPTPGQNIPTLLTVEETFGGSSINNGRNGISVNLQMTAATSATNPYRFYVASNALANMQNGDGGTAGTPQGAIEAVTGATILQGTSTNVKNMTGAEFSLSANSGSSVAQKAILTLDTFPTDAVHGVTNGATTGVDTFIWSFSEGVSFNTWAQIDLTGGVAPIATTGTVLKLIGSYTIGTGIDFGNLTISGNALQWANAAWFLAGNGNATLNTVTTGSGVCTVGTQITCTSSTSFQPAVTLVNTTNDANGVSIVTAKSRSGGAVNSGDTLGGLAAQAFTNANNTVGLAKFVATGAVSGANVPTAFQISTSTAAGLLSQNPLTAGAGVQIGAPTGGDKGAGTLNAAGAYYANGTVGINKTCSGASNNLVFTNGILTGGTC